MDKKDLAQQRKEKKEQELEEWKPKTNLGMKVKSGEITSMAQILDEGHKILEPEITETLLKDLSTELLLIGQAKGKFGGGQRRPIKQTQKKTNEGNKPSFTFCAVIGNKNGYLGIGMGKSRENVPAREKAIRKAKLNLIKIRRGSGSWESGGKTDKSIPYKTTGKQGSVKVTLIPAPTGTGLRIEKECATMLKLAGIQNIWSQTKGSTKTKMNLLYACFKSLQNLTQIKMLQKHKEQLGVIEGEEKKETIVVKT